MPRTYFSVVQYVPDQFADERVNIGIVLIREDGGYAKAVFPDSERRARRLSPGAKLAVIESVRNEITGRLPADGYQSRLGLEDSLDVDDLMRLHAERGNLIQFSEPRPSSADPVELTSRLTSMYLPALPHWHRARGTAAVRRSIRNAISQVGLSDLLREEVRARGKHDTYTFSFGIENGHVAHLIEATSLDRVNKEAVRDDLYAMAYRFEDLRRAEFEAPLSLVVGSEKDDLVRKARRLLGDIPRTSVVLESGLPRWAAKVERTLSAT